MEADRRSRTISIDLTTDEFFDVRDGNTLEGNFDVIKPGAKVEVTPLNNVEEDNSLKDDFDDDKTISNTSKAIIRQDGSLQILLSKRDLADIGATISRKNIEAPGAKDRSFVIKNIPGEGIVVNFGHLK
jgi:hypothetical protein